MTPGKIIFEKGTQLLGLYPGQGLWTHWLSPDISDDTSLPQAFSATQGLESALGESEPGRGKSFPPVYARQLIEDLDGIIHDKAERDLVGHAISDLASGKARAVVTGQQPGFSGGPLYCLYKIATTVAMARISTRQGQPTVPVFWMGDDDDDWQELVDPVFWDGVGDKFVKSNLTVGPRDKRPRMIGSLPVFPLEDTTFEILESLEKIDELSHALSGLFENARGENFSVSVLTEKILRCVFAGSGLVILRGNDSRLHSHCGDFYEKAIKLAPELAGITRDQSRLLEKRHSVTPISTNSLNRPLYISDGINRQPWDGQNIPTEFSKIRCGVLLRSMLQDWLLDPVAVVVGPGELSYLSQLVPAYERMGIPRSPLVPRLFGWVVPENLPSRSVEEFSNNRPMDEARAQELARVAGAAGEEKLIQILKDELGLDSDRAGNLAAGRTRRWVKGVQALLKNESQKQFKNNLPSKPAWVFPELKRQERKLAWIPVAAAWGWPLIEAVIEASEAHLIGGSQGDWNEYLLRVAVPKQWNEKGSGS